MPYIFDGINPIVLTRMMELIRIFILFSAFTFITISSSAKTIFVDDNASDGGDGGSWASAHKYLQDALASAEYGDEIWVAEGTYKPDQGAGKTAGDRASPFILVNGVGMYGGFLGTESSRDPQGDNNQTILSGEIDSNSSLWSLNVVSGGNLDANTTLNGFRITKGNANGASGTVYENGGGVYLSDSNLTVSNLVITNNSAGNGGGGIYSFSSYFSPYYYSSLTLTNCVFTNNSAGINGGGGGIYSYNHSSLTLTNCVFTNNSAGNGNGGGIYSFSDSYLTLTNCVFTNNSAGGGGGISYSYMTLTNCILWKNSSNSVEGHGLDGISFKSVVLQEAVKERYPGDPNAKDAVYEPNLNILQGWDGDARAFDADPLFVNIDNPIGPDGIWFTDDDGLRVVKGSPAIDSGYNESLPADAGDVDNDGNFNEIISIDPIGYRRVQNENVDIGAYEYGDELMPTKPQYQVAVSSNTGGFIPSGGGTYEEGYAVTITATPLHEGWIFTGWSGDASGTANPLTITADQDKTIVSNFAKDEADDDGDGISNFEEIVTYGTSKSSNDTDGDGLTDKEETERGLNPNSSDKAIIDAVMELKAMKAEDVTPIVSGWYYVPNHGWFWTNKDAYPYTYSATDKDWMYFQSGNDKPKFYRYKTKTWLTIE